MNYLAHLYLSPTDAGVVTGNFMADFVKGRVGTGIAYPPAVARGIVMHRSIDSFVERHPVFRRSRLRIDERYGHFRGVMIDLFYDHFLAKNWESYSTESFGGFLERVRASVVPYHDWLPERLKRLVPVIFNELLPSYRTTRGIGYALERMALRVSRPNPLKGGEEELVAHYDDFNFDFTELILELAERARTGLFADIDRI